MTPTSTTTNKMLECIDERKIATSVLSRPIKVPLTSRRHIVSEGAMVPTTTASSEQNRSGFIQLDECLGHANILLSRFLKIKPTVAAEHPQQQQPNLGETQLNGDLTCNINNNETNSNTNTLSTQQSISSASTAASVLAHYDKTSLSIQIPKIHISESSSAAVAVNRSVVVPVAYNNKLRNKLRRQNRKDLVYSPHMATCLSSTARFTSNENAADLDTPSRETENGLISSMNFIFSS